MKNSLQILFSRPLQYEGGILYGVRIPYDKDKAKHLMAYAVEWLIGKWCFEQRHGGKVENINKWIDASGDIYSSWNTTRLYSYTAALATQTYFRIDEWMVDDDCDLEGEVEITDPTEYFNTRCLLEEHDFKNGYNGWLQVYQKLVAKYQTLTQLGHIHNGMFKLEYEEQEDVVWLSESLE